MIILKKNMSKNIRYIILALISISLICLCACSALVAESSKETLDTENIIFCGANAEDFEKIRTYMKIDEVSNILQALPSSEVKNIELGIYILEYIIDEKTTARITFDDGWMYSVAVSDTDGNLLYFDAMYKDLQLPHPEEISGLDQYLDYSKYFTISEIYNENGNADFAYKIFNVNGEPIGEGIDQLHKPWIYQENENIISVFTWGGGSRYMQFFDIYDSRVSKVFEYYASEAGFYISRSGENLFAYATGDSDGNLILIVESIFNEDFYTEIELGVCPPIPPGATKIVFHDENEIFVEYLVSISNEATGETTTETKREIIWFR